ncbi:MAG TPA: glycosyltransferase family 2 protein [Chloroflexota bacterium]
MGGAGTTYLLIPVYNEAANVGELIEDIDLHAPQLASASNGRSLCAIFVDDGSTDDTSERILASGPETPRVVLRHGRNRGPGHAFRTGFRHLHAQLDERDLVMTLEGDNTSRLETAAQMMVRMREGYDAVLASPYAYGGGLRKTPLFREILSYGANHFAPLFMGIQGIHTCSYFFRLYSGELIGQLQQLYGSEIIEAAGFECMVELLLKMMAVGARISEVEMQLDSSRRTGASKMRVANTLLGYARVAANRHRWHRETVLLPQP